MIQFELLPELIAHFRLYSDHVWLDLEEFEIEEVLVPGARLAARSRASLPRPSSAVSGCGGKTAA